MSSKAYVYPWHEKSRAARDLSEALGIKRIRREGSTFVGNSDKVVINYGCSELPATVSLSLVLNKPKDVHASSNKLSFFKRMSQKHGPRIPEFTESLETAMAWVKEGILVVGRTQLSAHSGAGIVFMDNLADFVKAPLYTKYVKKKKEFRVHLMGGEILDVQQKVLRKTDEAGNPIDPKLVDFRVRSHANGFIFVRDNLRTPDDVMLQARLAFDASGLDFGAVDVIWNEDQGKAYVLEINTAPGLEGQTLENYVRGFRQRLL